MSVAPTLSLEFGASETRSMHCSWQDPRIRHENTCNDMRSLHDRLLQETGVDIDFLPYEGGDGLLLSGGGGDYELAKGGPRTPFPNHRLPTLIDTYNRHGFGFMVAMNGGAMLHPEVQFDIVNDRRFETEMRVLRLLQESAQQHGVKNWITIYRDELLHVVREHFPQLGTIASCIRFVGGAEGHFRGLEEEYRAALRDFDRVCPLNQHLIPDFIEQFGPNHMDQWVLLATSYCARADLRHCFRHYRMFPDRGPLAERGLHPHELAELCSGEYDLDASFGGIPRLPRVTTRPADGFTVTHGGDCFHHLAPLTSRRLHLDRFIALGIDKFKFPRTTGKHLLDDSNMTVVLNSFRESHQRSR